MEEGTEGWGHGDDIREVEGRGCLGTFREESSASFLTLWVCDVLALGAVQDKREGRRGGICPRYHQRRCTMINRR